MPKGITGPGVASLKWALYGIIKYISSMLSRSNANSPRLHKDTIIMSSFLSYALSAISH